MRTVRRNVAASVRNRSDPGPMVYRFHPFQADAAKGCLLRNGAEIPLRRKAFQVLLALLENRDIMLQVVGKSEIQAEALLRRTPRFAAPGERRRVAVDRQNRQLIR